MNNSGIYYILHLSSGRHYVGSAKSLIARKRSHFWNLKNGPHHNSKLQRSWNKYGELDFSFHVLEECTPESLEDREQFWMDATRPYYNILRKARSAQGFVMPEDVKQKIGQNTKSKYAALSEDEKRRRAELHAQKITGRRASEETRKKMSESHKAVPVHENSIKNLFEARLLDPDYYFKAADARAKTWYIVTTPDGEELRVRNMSKFCRENNLSQGHMSGMACGRRKYHKGWLCRYENEIRDH